MTHDEFKAECASIQTELTAFDSHTERPGAPGVDAEYARLTNRIAVAQERAVQNGWDPCGLDFSYDPTT